MPTYEVDWIKTYVRTGTVTVEAEDTHAAETIVDEQIGDYEGSMQYLPGQNETRAYLKEVTPK